MTNAETVSGGITSQTNERFCYRGLSDNCYDLIAQATTLAIVTSPFRRTRSTASVPSRMQAITFTFSSHRILSTSNSLCTGPHAQFSEYKYNTQVTVAKIFRQLTHQRDASRDLSCLSVDQLLREVLHKSTHRQSRCIG
jgi:hypothetical protein